MALFASGGGAVCIGFIVLMVIFTVISSSRTLQKYDAAKKGGGQVPDEVCSTRGVRTGPGRYHWHALKVPPKGRDEAARNAFVNGLVSAYFWIPFVFILVGVVLTLLKKHLE